MNASLSETYLIPSWPAPARVRAFTSTRGGGVSQAPYTSFNCADHVGDDPQAVSTNRRILAEQLGLPSAPYWLQQVHGTQVVQAGAAADVPQADACVAFDTDRVCVVLTADCLPVLFCDSAGTRVGAAHAGWRGLASGVLESTVEAMDCDPHELLAWMGPAIGPQAFEVGAEVREVFVAQNAAASSAFVDHRGGHYLADLYALARQRLLALGLQGVYGGDYCSYTDATRFYSYRRERDTGRMSSLIWLAAPVGT